MPRHAQTLTVLALGVGLATGLAPGAADGKPEEQRATAHLTLYVGGELLDDGGTVIVTSIPLAEAELRQLTGPNPVGDDPASAKRSSISSDDLLFGAYVTARANFVRMYYPDGGRFGLNFVVDPKEEHGRDLRTEQVLVGSTGMPHPEDPALWVNADTSTIPVLGPKASRRESRMLRVEEWRIMEQPVRTEIYRGVTVFIPTEEQLKAATAGNYGN